MIIVNLTQANLNDVNSLLVRTAMLGLTPEHLDNALGLVAYDGDKPIGCLWVGLMAKGTVGYIDKFYVDPDYTKKGIGNQMAKEMLSRVKALGVSEVFGIIGHHQFHDQSGMNALKVAMGGDKVPYTLVTGNVNFMCSELGI